MNTQEKKNQQSPCSHTRHENEKGYSFDTNVKAQNSLREIEYYDRYQERLCEETVMGEGMIRWAYQTLSGEIFSTFIFGNSILSRMLGLYFDSSLSKRQIKKTITDLAINTDEFELDVDEFKSFNRFFTRHLKEEARPFEKDEGIIVSPADGRVLVYPDASKESIISIKGMHDSVQNFIGEDIEGFDNCSVAVIRLCPSDYHRYHFPCNGEILKTGKLSGKYHSVNPIALDAVPNVFCRNKREFALCNTQKGEFIISEVGAFGVAGIIQTHTVDKFSKMDEKGYFKFGGSTVILIFPKGTVQFDEDLVKYSEKGTETLIHVGDNLAMWK